MAALQKFSADPDRLLHLCVQRARGARPEAHHLEAATAERSSGDPLIQMLARLCQAEPSATH
jgi:hypothetical protein